MKLYTLGCNGWIPGINQTCSFMIEHKNKLIILDMGSGIINLKNYRNVLEHYQELHVILSHYHLDHIIGLSYILPYVKEKKVIIYGPGKPEYEMSTEEILNAFLHKNFFSCPLDKIANEITCIDYAGNDFKIGEINVYVKRQIHTSPSYQIDIEHILVYMTDTTFIGIPAQCNILLHEGWNIDYKDNGHTSVTELIGGLEGVECNKILLIHQNPEWNAEDIEKIKNLIEHKNIVLPNDLEVFEIE